MDIQVLENYLNDKSNKIEVNQEIFKPTLVIIAFICMYKGYYLALCLIFSSFSLESSDTLFSPLPTHSSTGFFKSTRMRHQYI